MAKGTKTKKFESRIRTAGGVFLLVCADLFILLAVVSSSVAVRVYLLPVIFHSMPVFKFEPGKYYWLFPVWLAVLAYNGAYTKRFTFWDEVRALWKADFIVFVAVFAFLFIGKQGVQFSRAFLLSVCLLSLLFFPLLRPALKRVIYRLGFLRRKLLILGSGEAALKAMRAVRMEKNLGYDVAGFIGAGGGGLIEGFKVHGFMDKADRYIERCGIQDVMIAAPDLERERLANIINRVQHRAENTLYMPDVAAVAVLGAEFRHFGNQEGLVIEIKNNLRKPQDYILKKVFDFTLGLALTAVFLAPIPVISLILKATSRGPVIFRQRRIGKGGRIFWCYKFRTMHKDAEDRLREILKADPEARRQWETYWKLKDDPRVTAVGSFLRKSSLDELPQLMNVLKGQMSIVGPRPYLENERDHLLEFEETILRVPPGITGFWQISGRSAKTFGERLALDLWYVRNWNVWLDIVILFKTVRVVWTGEGAR